MITSIETTKSFRTSSLIHQRVWSPQELAHLYQIERSQLPPYITPHEFVDTFLLCVTFPVLAGPDWMFNLTHHGSGNSGFSRTCYFLLDLCDTSSLRLTWFDVQPGIVQVLLNTWCWTSAILKPIHQLKDGRRGFPHPDLRQICFVGDVAVDTIRRT